MLPNFHELAVFSPENAAFTPMGESLLYSELAVHVDGVGRCWFGVLIDPFRLNHILYSCWSRRRTRSRLSCSQFAEQFDRQEHDVYARLRHDCGGNKG